MSGVHSISAAELDLRLDWSEQDLFGHINNVSFFKYLQAGRVNLWEKTSVLKGLESENTGPMLASARCDFKKPLFYPGTIRIRSNVSGIKNTSFGIVHTILDHKGEVAAEGHDIIVMYNFGKDEKVAISPQLRDELESFLIKL